MDKMEIIVTVNEGKIRGIRQKSRFSGVNYYSFFGVPYGKSTAGLERFKDPVEAVSWANVLNTKNEKEGCLQFSKQLKRFSGSEDCLYNNIHTPTLPTENNPLKPVIVCIHPGGLIYGSPETWCYGSPDYVMHTDIVYVCIAYRLHILGFLNLDLEDCAGSQVFKDILLSLRWIKKNINVFGGDPNNITLLGSSSGAAIVHGLMLSPAAKGFFHKAVMMGMYAFCPTSIMRKDHKKEAYEIAKSLGYKNVENDDRMLLSYYKNLSIHKFIELRSELACNLNSALLFPINPFTAIVDKGKHSIFPQPSNQLINSTARIPLMFGICERESAMGFTKLLRDSTMKHFYQSYRQNCTAWGYDITDEEAQVIQQQINKFYLKDCPLETVPLSVKVDIQTDISFSSVYNTLIDVVAADLPSSVFVYKFQYDDGNVDTMKNKIFPMLDEPLEGNCHGADFNYWACTENFWGTKTPPLSYKSREIVETFTNLISTFARTGNPNYEGLKIEWKPTTPQKPCYLSIDENLRMVNTKLNGERMEFWENIQKQFKKD